MFAVFVKLEVILGKMIIIIELFCLVIDGWGIFYEIDHRWFSLDLTGDKSALLQVTPRTPSYYQNQCWPSYISPYGVNRPSRVNTGFYVKEVI